MVSTRLAACLMILAISVAHLAAQQTTFRAGTELVSVAATVTDRRGQFLTDLTLEDFECSRAALAGLLLARGGVADLADGRVSDNLIGVSVQTLDFDLGRLQNRVIYVDNERNLDAAVLPVPGAVGDVGP